MSFLRTFWRTIYRPRYFVGTDLEGNRFFEYPSLTDEPLRTRRRIQYKVYDDMWDYVGGARRLSVQWVSWLSHTRPDPPTLEELRADLERQRRVLHNAAVIQARDQEERARIFTASEAVVVENTSSTTPQGIPTGEMGSQVHSDDSLEESLPFSQQIKKPQRAPRPSHDSALPPIGKDRDWQPEAWMPQTARRGGG